MDEEEVAGMTNEQFEQFDLLIRYHELDLLLDKTKDEETIQIIKAREKELSDKLKSIY